jgi:hypothetical protein
VGVGTGQCSYKTMQRELVDFVAELTRESRLILLGGLAVIGHGMDRGTKDADLWMEPMNSTVEWLNVLNSILSKFEGARIVTLPGWQNLSGADLVENLEQVGMIRVEGLGVPLDLFRKPNGVEIEEFDEIWERSRSLPDHLGLPHPLDLVRTKENTQRPHDQNDHVYLMSVAREAQGDALASASNQKEALVLIDEFYDYAVLERGLDNPLPEVREVIWSEIEQLTDDGDPFAKELLEARKSD